MVQEVREPPPTQGRQPRAAGCTGLMNSEGWHESGPLRDAAPLEKAIGFTSRYRWSLP